MSDFTRTPVRGIDLGGVVGGCILALLAGVLIAKNLSVDNAVVFHDEYVYRIWSDSALTARDILDKDLAPPIPNRLFSWVYRVASIAGSNAYDLAQLLNVGFWSVGCLLTYAMARRQGGTAKRFVVLAAAIALLPLSGYTKYFMPEVMYGSMFLGGALLITKGDERGAIRWFLAAGALTGAMYYVKPHALFALGIDVVFVMTLRNRWRSLLGLIVGFACAFLLVRITLPSSSAGPGGLGVYNDILSSLFQRLDAYAGHPAKLLADLVDVAAAHASMFLLYSSVPLVATIGRVFPRLGWYRTSEEESSLSLYLLIATVVLISIAVVFTVFAGEVGRIHSRYYMFLAPLWLIELSRSDEGRFSRYGAYVVSGLVVFSGGWLLLRGASYSPILSLSFVSDGPEWGVLFARSWLVVLTVSSVVVASLCVAWTGRGVMALLFAVMAMSLVATVMTVIQQKGPFRNAFVDGRDAVAVHQWLGSERLSHALVVARDRIELDKFLFFLDSAPFVVLAPGDADLHALVDQRPGLRDLILLSPDYVPPARSQCHAFGDLARVCRIGETSSANGAK